MVQYRLLSPPEMPTAVSLWVDVFGVEARFFETLLESGEVDDFSVGAFDAGTLVSSVHVFMRRLRDREGRPLKVGGIGSVSTIPEARSKGHSSRLLELSIEEMAKRECVWSYLGTGVNDHYARHGWRSFSTQCFIGTLAPQLTPEPLDQAMVDDRLLADMAAVHAEFTRTLPMANDRSKAMWDSAVRYRITGATDQVFTTYAGEKLHAYLVARRSVEAIELVEAACVNGMESELAGLVSQRLAFSASMGIRQVRSMLPKESPTFEAIRMACDKLQPGEDRAWMGLPIADRISWPNLAGILTDPRGRRSDLDNF